MSSSSRTPFSAFPHPFSMSSPLLRLSDSEYSTLQGWTICCTPCSRLPEYFKSHPLESPSSPTHNPYSWTYGLEGQDRIKAVGRSPEKLRKFAIGISVGTPPRPVPHALTSRFVPQGNWSTVPAVGIYPSDTELAPLSTACQRKNRVLVVDVGASRGGTMKEIRQTFPPPRPTGRILTQDLVPRRRPRPGGSPAPGAGHPSDGPRFLAAAAGEERVRFITGGGSCTIGPMTVRPDPPF
ncbi:hypothetical protein HO173_011338 [Letharia columbiana]|uniref:Uncharacterized protein n=1 Tax=Letharia columbiana TaxID=112416 RepID=A0A8H6FJL6_9LECA|nr:uncharacterized protein HO173_011338 [Letharia columbiana]KAF6229692.1 hypothetical protein HO173_011338 [Letharia columbiana]